MKVEEEWWGLRERKEKKGIKWIEEEEEEEEEPLCGYKLLFQYSCK